MHSLQNKTKSTAGDHDRDNPTGRVQRQGVGEDKEYMAYKMASIPVLIRVPIKYSEGEGAKPPQ